MTQVYRAGQKEIGHLALAELARQTTALLHTTFSVDESTTSTNQSLSQGDAASSDALKEHSGDAPWQWGWEVLQDAQPGQELARLPLAAGLAADSREGLVMALAMARIKNKCTTHCSSSSRDGQLELPHARAASHGDALSAEGACWGTESSLLDTLVRHAGVPFAASLVAGVAGSLCAAEAAAGELAGGFHIEGLPLSDLRVSCGQSVMLLRRAVCPGTPLEDTLQDECKHLQQHCAAGAAVLGAALEMSRTADASSTDHHDAREQQAAGPSSKLCPGISHAEVMKAVAWAEAVVDHCGLAGPSGCQTCILPLICAMPKVNPHHPDGHIPGSW